MVLTWFNTEVIFQCKSRTDLVSLCLTSVLLIYLFTNYNANICGRWKRRRKCNIIPDSLALGITGVTGDAVHATCSCHGTQFIKIQKKKKQAQKKTKAYVLRSPKSRTRRVCIHARNWIILIAVVLGSFHGK